MGEIVQSFVYRFWHMIAYMRGGKEEGVKNSMQ